ncbi:MAG TPA: bifunctional DNA-formamidopyrimidine glycosylase/DNA-(apurinic or apyrimidinic site) lyase [Chloroflexota bacterium]|nr:bifunctional DNA-formamidopyrimidine glycosylase/DNA-(apurinic or apyrimidinic site) lyase [Chloroflexota bacterium]
MPELPEVQSVVDELAARLPGRSFTGGSELLWAPVVGHPHGADFSERLDGRVVRGVRRRAKYIIIDLDAGQVLVVHLRMTGRLHFAAPDEAPDRHLRARLPLDDGTELRFADMRKFGRLYLGTEAEVGAVTALGSLGPEPLEGTFTTAVLGARLAGKRGPIKSALLDQSVLSGLGNIYADEALFRAGIAPRRAAGSLNEEELAALRAGIVATLSEAVERGGTSFQNYLSVAGRKGGNMPNLRVFRRDGEPCLRCETVLERTVVGGRGTHWCPGCQH